MSKQAILELDHDACKTQAMAYLEQGFNCAQAVACTLAPAIGLDVDQTFRLMEGFGGGMGTWGRIARNEQALCEDALSGFRFFRSF